DSLGPRRRVDLQVLEAEEVLRLTQCAHVEHEVRALGYRGKPLREGGLAASGRTAEPHVDWPTLTYARHRTQEDLLLLIDDEILIEPRLDEDATPHQLFGVQVDLLLDAGLSDTRRLLGGCSIHRILPVMGVVDGSVFLGRMIDLVAVPLQALEQVVQVGAQHVGMPDRDAGLAIVVGDLDRVFLVLADTEGGERIHHRLDPRATARAFLRAAEIPIHEVERAGEGEGAQNDHDRLWRDDGLHDARALDLGHSPSFCLCHSVLLYGSGVILRGYGQGEEAVEEQRAAHEWAPRQRARCSLPLRVAGDLGEADEPEIRGHDQDTKRIASRLLIASASQFAVRDEDCADWIERAPVDLGAKAMEHGMDRHPALLHVVW